MRIALILLLFAWIEPVHPYKILVFSPRFLQSVNNFLGNIADTLVDAGHNVTTLIPIVNPNQRDGTIKSNMIYVQPTEEANEVGIFFFTKRFIFFRSEQACSIRDFQFGRLFSAWQNAQCKGVLDEPGLLERLKAEKYDIMIVESLETCGIAVSHLIKPKSLITTAGSVPFPEQGTDFGISRAQSFNPSVLMSQINVHSIWSRLWNLYANFVYIATWSTSRSGVNEIFHERYGPDFPSVQEIGSHSAYSLVNSEPLIDFAAPTLNRVVCIGGIGAKEPKPLERDLDRLFEFSLKTVLISFGSILQSHKLPLQVKQSIVKTVVRFPEVTFLWKYERPEDEFAKSATASTPNLHMLKWTPQNDILADRRLTAFITHGGMASTQETALRGKPGLFIPFFGDQPRNAGMMQKNGLGRIYSKYDLLDAEKFYGAVKDLLENQSYYENAARVAAMIAKKPFSSKELLMKTVEFAAEFGPSPALRPQSFDMNWIEYHNADIIVAFMMMTLVSALAVVKIVPFV
ncbi:hypothetical protein PENTCL1PPCAC_21393, partial [Pristionchus entomophagus]